MRHSSLILFLFLVINASSQISKEHFKDFKIITDMFDSAKKVTFVRYKMKSLERIENGFNASNTNIKLQTSPRKVYLKNPDKKLEVLYNEELSKDKCTVKPHVFPYFTMNLEPRGNLMRKNQHFTIHEIGFEFTVKTIAIALSKEKDQILKHLTNSGEVTKNGMKCHLMIYENLTFNYVDYIVQDKETVTSIANKFIVNDYMVRTKNKLYDNYGYLKKGSVIKIPNFYCKKAIFYIDKKTMLPISMQIYDEVGIFENYDYFDIELNKPIPKDEFTKSYKDYDF